MINRRNRMRVIGVTLLAGAFAAAGCLLPVEEDPYPATAAGAEAFVSDVNSDLLDQAIAPRERRAPTQYPQDRNGPAGAE